METVAPGRGEPTRLRPDVEMAEDTESTITSHVHGEEWRGPNIDILKANILVFLDDHCGAGTETLYFVGHSAHRQTDTRLTCANAGEVIEIRSGPRAYDAVL